MKRLLSPFLFCSISLSDCILRLLDLPHRALKKKREDGALSRERRETLFFFLSFIDGIIVIVVFPAPLLPLRRARRLPVASDGSSSRQQQQRRLSRPGIGALRRRGGLGERARRRWNESWNRFLFFSFDLLVSFFSVPPPLPRVGRGARLGVGPARVPCVLGHLLEPRNQQEQRRRRRREMGVEEEGRLFLPGRRLRSSVCRCALDRALFFRCCRPRSCSPAAPPPPATDARGPPRRHRRRRGQAHKRGVGVGSFFFWHHRRRRRERRRGGRRKPRPNHRRPSLPDRGVAPVDGRGGGEGAGDAPEDDDREQQRRERGRRRRKQRGGGGSSDDDDDGCSFNLRQRQPRRPCPGLGSRGRRRALRALAL